MKMVAEKYVMVLMVKLKSLKILQCLTIVKLNHGIW